MGTGKIVWAGESTYLATNGYGGGTSDLAADAAYDYGADMDFETNGYLGAKVYLEHDSSGTTDNITLGFFASVNGSDFADNPKWEIEYDATSGADTQEDSISIDGEQHGRLGVKGGNTDTFDYRIRVDYWRYDVS